ncbi:hypothetical protein GCM10012320_14920 [Sinomonas cellulolyticus]|nr:hypothetical protein GCM10012320_14920 [Sinomonas sp. KCTC 49339]
MNRGTPRNLRTVIAFGRVTTALVSAYSCPALAPALKNLMVGTALRCGADAPPVPRRPPLPYARLGSGKLSS